MFGPLEMRMVGITDIRTHKHTNRQTSAGLLLFSDPPEETLEHNVFNARHWAFMLYDFE